MTCFQRNENLNRVEAMNTRESHIIYIYVCVILSG